MWHFRFFITITLAISATLTNSLQSRTVNGNEAFLGEFPWMVSLRISATSEPICGGALVTPEHVVTAAFCLLSPTREDGMFYPDEIFVVTGHVDNLKGGRNTAVSDIRVHEDLDLTLGFRNNIAVLKLKIAIPFTAVEQPIALASKKPGVGRCVLSGWGTTYFPSSAMPSQLQKIILHSMSLETCLRSWSSLMAFESTLCAGGVPSVGACIGDFGSPLICDRELAGIVSWMDFCARGNPDLFTDVFYFSDWIRDNTKDLSPLGRMYEKIASKYR